METVECLTVLSNILTTFERDGGEEILESYKQNLTLLSASLSSANSDVGFRRELAESQSVWIILAQIFSFHLKNNQSHSPLDEIWRYRIRTVRGAGLLARSLITSCTPDDTSVQPYVENIHSSISSITRLSLDELGKDDLSDSAKDLHTKLISSNLQYLINLMNTKLGDEYHGAVDYKLAGDLLERIVQVEKSTQSPDLEFVEHTLYLINTLVDNDEFFSKLIEGQKTFFSFLNAMLDIFEEFSTNVAPDMEITVDQDLNSIELLVISIFTKVITKPQFLTWIDSIDPFHDDFPRYLKLFQTIIVNKDSWNLDQSIVLISWLARLFDHLAVDDNTLLTTSLNKLLVSTLDSISSICQYEQVRQYINEYDYLNKMLKLLKILSIRVPRKALKDSPSTIQFPNVKSIIIEILTFLVHNNFKNQEAMRNLQGIEIILNNCNIDENEPFIKERSILCIKYLLENNQANQDFVAKLEAKKVANDKVLSEAGYEVNIVDGKVRLKPPQPKPQ